jgi:hypothetical protein
MQRLVLVLWLLVAGTPPAFAQTDADFVLRYCDDGHRQIILPDSTRADCIGPTHAKEIEISDYWYSALGQALNYAYWTREIAGQPKAYPGLSKKITAPMKAGIVLVCRRPRDTCTNHYVRLFRIIEEFRLPITIWDCNSSDEKLDNCQKIDMPPLATEPKIWTIAALAGLVTLLAGLVWLNARQPPTPLARPPHHSSPNAAS